MQQSLVMHVVLIFFNDTATTEIYTLSLLDALPIFMRYLESVTVTGEGRSHWVAKAPGGSVEWDAEVTEDRRSEEHTSELQSRQYLVCRLLLEKTFLGQLHLTGFCPSLPPARHLARR